MNTLTPEYLEWEAKLELPSILSDKTRSRFYNRYKKKTGLDPWINSETSESKQDAGNHLSQDCIIKISKFPEEKSTIHKAVHKRFPFLSCTNSNAWYRDVFKYTDSEAKCPVCKDVHTHLGIWATGVYAIEHGMDPEKFSVITEAEKNRWAMGCFRGDLERDIRFY
ncbi:2314_t:CDS:2, partial [Racocetra fulgida]